LNDQTRPEITLTWIRRAARGERRDERRLIEALTPIIRGSVTRTMRRRAARRRAVDQEVEDVVQSVLLVLFARGGNCPLLRWDPARGLDVASFVSLLASREATSILRSARRNPWTEEPTGPESLDEAPASGAGPESLAGSRRLAEAVTAGLRARVSPRGQRMFELLFLEGRPAAEVAALTGVGLSAVQAWSSRLARLARAILAGLDAAH
jgi:RNA polymerase sigma-70 factor (ECF subfamily)